MPELPEVETVRRAMRALEGDTIVKIVLHREGLRIPFPPDLATRLEGRKILRVDRRAKYILTHLDDNDVFVLHLGMSGRVMLAKAGEHRIEEKHDHFTMTTKKKLQVMFHDPRRFGMAFMVRDGDLAAHPAFRDLGPEPFGGDFTPASLAASLAGKTTPVKVALLDQHLVAGIGNIYASEALFYAGIDPRTPAGEVARPRLKKLHSAIRLVLERAIAAGGTSFRDFRSADGGGGYFQRELAVYDRTGQACGKCTCDPARTGGVEQFTQGGRSTFWCPRRQG